MADREPGPYWVRDRFDDDWVDAKWTGTAWLLHGDTTEYKDGAFLEIGPRAEMPPLVIDKPPSPEVVHYDITTPDGKRALAAFLKLPEWPEPQPITDAHKGGERFLVWNSRGWVIGSWRYEFGDEQGEKMWTDDHDNQIGNPTLILSLPPDVTP